MSMKNPNHHGVLVVETKGKGRGSKCYPGPTHDGRSVHYKVYEGAFKNNGFNPKKLSLHGEEIIIYAKNMTLKFDIEGNVTTLPVDHWRDGIQ